MNFFQRFLTSRFFPLVAGTIVVILVGLTILSFLPKRGDGGNRTGGGLTGLFGLPNLFDSQDNQSLSIEQTVQRQILVSREVVNWEKKVAGRFIWRRKLPLTSDKYFIYFDLSKKSFIARLYPDNDDLIPQIQAETIRILKKEKEIPLESFSIDWDVYPRSSFQ